MKTAVEFLAISLKNHPHIKHSFRFKELVKQAKEMEKEQLEKAWQDGAETAQNDAAKEIRNNYTPNKL